MTAFAENGRWGGRLGSRPEPENDPSIDALARSQRGEVARIWLSRAAMERRVADSFAVIRDALARRGAPSELVTLAARAVDDEHRHAELSRVVASRYEGAELAAPPRLPLEVPEHRGASEAVRDTLYVIGQCVLNETTAGVVLETCLEHARAPVATWALRELLSDEIEHGRIGWTYLASVDRATRRAAEPWLLPMTYLNLKLWREETPLCDRDEALAAHGAPHNAILHEALVDAVRSLVVPGLRALEMDVGPIERWLDAGASTDAPPT